MRQPVGKQGIGVFTVASAHEDGVRVENTVGQVGLRKNLLVSSSEIDQFLFFSCLCFFLTIEKKKKSYNLDINNENFPNRKVVISFFLSFF